MNNSKTEKPGEFKTIQKAAKNDDDEKIDERQLKIGKKL